MRVEIEDVPDVCKYCRKIMKQSNYPKTLEIYRGSMLCLTVDVERASKLRVVENQKRGPLHEKYHEGSLLKGNAAVYVATTDAFKSKIGG